MTDVSVKLILAVKTDNEGNPTDTFCNIMKQELNLFKKENKYEENLENFENDDYKNESNDYKNIDDVTHSNLPVQENANNCRASWEKSEQSSLQNVWCTKCGKNLNLCNCCKMVCVNLVRLNSLNVYGSEKRKQKNDFKSCNICCKVFRKKGSFYVHMSRHRNNKIFFNKCDICGLKIYSHFSMGHASAILKVHQRVHTGEKPFACTECDMTFAQSSTLADHIRIHKRNNSELGCVLHGKLFSTNCKVCQDVRIKSGGILYACKYCQRVFASKSGRLYHVKTKHHISDEIYQCFYCKSTFKQKCELVVHIRLHTNEKLYKCDVCSQTFLKLNYMRTHIKTGCKNMQKIYLCTKCNMRYATTGGLTRHTRSLHGADSSLMTNI